MRIAIFGVAALAAIVGCSSSSDTLSPGPSTDLAGGGSTHSDDTTITNGPKTPPPPPPVVSSFTLSGAVYGRELGPDTAAVPSVIRTSAVGDARRQHAHRMRSFGAGHR